MYYVMTNALELNKKNQEIKFQIKLLDLIKMIKVLKKNTKKTYNKLHPKFKFKNHKDEACLDLKLKGYDLQIELFFK